jgi:predicted adenylyl cyclase CyaB
MNIKDLIKKEQRFSRLEYQIKVKADVSEEDVRKLGARELGSVLHEDKYFLPKGIPLEKTGELIRIRKEGGENHLSVFRGMVAHEHMRTRLVLTKHVTDKDIATLAQTYTETIAINKRRIIYMLDHIVINLDHVENLGSYIEFDIGTRQEYTRIESLMRQLGLTPQEITNKSYFELGLAKFNSQVRLLGNLHARFGKFAFGIASAVLTTLGIIVGINSATASRLAIIGGIVAVAVADSLSDAVGMYSQKVSERGTTTCHSDQHLVGHAALGLCECPNCFCSRAKDRKDRHTKHIYCPLGYYCLLSCRISCSNGYCLVTPQYLRNIYLQGYKYLNMGFVYFDFVDLRSTVMCVVYREWFVTTPVQ